MFIYKIIITLKTWISRKGDWFLEYGLKTCLSAIPGSRNLKKGIQIGPKFKRGFGTQESHLALLGCRLAQKRGSARGLLDWDKPYRFWVFRDKDVSQFVSDHSTNFRSIPSFINRGCLSKFSTSNLPSFWLFFFDFSIPLTLKTFWKLLL